MRHIIVRKYYLSVIEYRLVLLEKTIIDRLVRLGADEQTVDKLVNEYAEFISINPFAYPPSELYAYELELLNKTKADLVVFHATDLCAYALGSSFLPLLYNKINYAKKLRKTLFLMIPRIDEHIYKLCARFADVVIDYYSEERETLRIGVRLWIRGYKPVKLDSDIVEKCIMEAYSIVSGKH
ncbi:MAG: hypothetical protein ABWW65_06180 [Thermoprotei archaeon]